MDTHPLHDPTRPKRALRVDLTVEADDTTALIRAFVLLAGGFAAEHDGIDTQLTDEAPGSHWCLSAFGQPDGLAPADYPAAHEKWLWPPRPARKALTAKQRQREEDEHDAAFAAQVKLEEETEPSIAYILTVALDSAGTWLTARDRERARRWISEVVDRQPNPDPVPDESYMP